MNGAMEISKLRLERRLQPRSASSSVSAAGYAVSIGGAGSVETSTYRVVIDKASGLAVLGFSKHGTIGIGLSSDDNNTNLPCGIATVKTVCHIDDGITDPVLIAAGVDLVRRAAYEDHGGPWEGLRGRGDWEVDGVVDFDPDEVARAVTESRAQCDDEYEMTTLHGDIPGGDERGSGGASGRAEAVEEACVVMHDAYERAAVGAGWETNPASRKPWSDVPEANKETMRAAVGALLDHLAARGSGGEAGP